MRLGLSSYTYGWAVGEGKLTALDLLQRCREMDVSVLQLCDNLPAETWRDAALDGLHREAVAAGVTLEVGTRGCATQHLQSTIDIARRVGSGVLRLVLDAPGDEPTPDEVVRRLRPLLAVLQRSQVTLAIESHDRFRSATLAAIVRELDHPHVGICLDTVNSFGALEGPQVVVEALGALTVSLHLKDFVVQRVPYLQGFVIEGRPAGEGMLDVPWLLGRLRHFGRDPNAIVELWTPPPPDAAVAAVIDKEAAWARQSVRSLRQWIPD